MRLNGWKGLSWDQVRLRSRIKQLRWELEQLERLLPDICPICKQSQRPAFPFHRDCWDAAIAYFRKHEERPVNRVWAVLCRLSREQWLSRKEAWLLADRLMEFVPSGNPNATLTALGNRLDETGLYRGEPLVDRSHPRREKVVRAMQRSESKGETAMLVAALTFEIKEKRREQRKNQV